VLDSAERPLLSESGIEIGRAAIGAEDADVLNDSCFLIVGFFDQEAVVLNARRGLILLRTEKCWCETQHEQQIVQLH
jgi:hypothetical protein